MRSPWGWRRREREEKTLPQAISSESIQMLFIRIKPRTVHFIYVYNIYSLHPIIEWVNMKAKAKPTARKRWRPCTLRERVWLILKSYMHSMITCCLLRVRIWAIPNNIDHFYQPYYNFQFLPLSLTLWPDGLNVRWALHWSFRNWCFAITKSIMK